ncbi:PadR family transcriptional regulator [Anaerocolumna xylanovorans]|uniref:PadR family transcriptional regulator, regulatory protein PadR n=1 Tax=Anaerocolumna xylanovorans DSM 12503 TaxID=1121345 RepID=A0A1M7Y4W0_9FIRM|nr:PadR family transcriptional regulator [Anaerocolumna xylanovorans]SHO47327.1 PadR family transcriptional regulator, regulatory protein PadR [Anaerocolumna xylanovorans DSM 12503]
MQYTVAGAEPTVQKYQNKDLIVTKGVTMEDSQLLKGILEGCVLAIIAKGETYGYDILSVLERHGFKELQEGTLYPVLVRLEKKKDIQCRIGSSPYGPKRKYYSITPGGEEHLKQFLTSYENLIDITNSILYPAN